MVCDPISKQLKKDAPTKWTEECQAAFNAIKNYILIPLVMVPPRGGSPLLLYLSVLDSALGCVLTRKKESLSITYARSLLPTSLITLC